MSMYSWLKLVHIVSAIVAVGTLARSRAPASSSWGGKPTSGDWYRGLMDEVSIVIG